jgi:hypothetical protein
MDTLVLAFDLVWPDKTAFDVLKDLKAKAKADSNDATGIIRPAGEDEWLFAVKPHGRDGYEWILDSMDYAMTLSAQTVPGSRPSAMAALRSILLWHLGPVDGVQRLLAIFDAMHAEVESVKVSRVDLCLDILLDESSWSLGLLDHIVTRAASRVPYFQHRTLTGIGIGKGDISARLYDKPLEIRQQSKKEWMYDIWNIERVPENGRVIRNEFQLRRQILKDLGVSTFDDLMGQVDHLWSYCTRWWLKLQDDGTKHHTQQATLPWWVMVQDGYNGVQGAAPSVRAKAVRANQLQIDQQLLGYIVAHTALEHRDQLIAPDETLNSQKHLNNIKTALDRLEVTAEEFTERVKRKQVKLHTAKEKHAKAVEQRQQLGLSSDEPPSDAGPSS